MIGLLRAEFLKLRTTQVWFWLLLGALAVTVLFVVGQLAPSSGARSESQVPAVFTGAGIAYIVVFVLGVLGVTTEFRYQTITPTLLTTPSRWTVVGAKMLAYLLIGVAYALVCTGVMLAVAVPWLATLGVTVQFGSWAVWHAIGGVFLVVALFGIIGLGFGALVRNQIVGVTVGVIWLLILNNVVAVIPGVRVVYPYTPGGGVASIFASADSAPPDGVHLLPFGGGVGVLLAYAIVPAVLGAALTLNRDIT